MSYTCDPKKEKLIRTVEEEDGGEKTKGKMESEISRQKRVCVVERQRTCGYYSGRGSVCACCRYGERGTSWIISGCEAFLSLFYGCFSNERVVFPSLLVEFTNEEEGII